jgi:hypothetical protein
LESAFLNQHNLTPDTWRKKLRDVKDKLLEFREKRIRPGLDDKVITSWNAMMTIGLTDAYKYIGDEELLKAAVKNMQFLENELMEGTTIYRSYKNKRSNTKGFLDDYAYVIAACIRLYQVTFNEYWIKRAELLTTFTIEQFFDAEDGFFFYTSKDSEALIARRKEIFDNVIPSSNSVMIRNLYQLGNILQHDRWVQMAEATVSPLAHLIISEPNYMSNWAIVYSEMKKGMAEVVFSGDQTKSMVKAFNQYYQPFSLLMGTEKTSALPLIDGKTAIDGKSAIYVCFKRTCQRPVFTVEDAIEQIEDLT